MKGRGDHGGCSVGGSKECLIIWSKDFLRTTKMRIGFKAGGVVAVSPETVEFSLAPTNEFCKVTEENREFYFRS